MSNTPHIKRLMKVLGIGLPDHARAMLKKKKIVITSTDDLGTVYTVEINNEGTVRRKRTCSRDARALDIYTTKEMRRSIPYLRNTKVIPFCRNYAVIDADKAVSREQVAQARLMIGMRIYLDTGNFEPYYEEIINRSSLMK